MNAPVITFETPSGKHLLPNSWENLSPSLFLFLCGLLKKYAEGSISYRHLHLEYVIRALGMDPAKLKGEQAFQNLYLLSESVDFIFKDPETVNNCFLAQLVPKITVAGRSVKGYEINTGFDTLTCSLSAIRFIEAYELLAAPSEKHPLLVAILYLPGEYSSERAHLFAQKMATVDPVTLSAVIFNFQAFCNYLFTRTHYSILYNRNKSEKAEISISMADSLYNLSADGLGDADAIERMPVIKYLSILRKKLIESVTAMHTAEMDLVEIADKTGLPVQTIKKII